jgi:hypothetical protein
LSRAAGLIRPLWSSLKPINLSAEELVVAPTTNNKSIRLRKNGTTISDHVAVNFTFPTTNFATHNPRICIDVVATDYVDVVCFHSGSGGTQQVSGGVENSYMNVEFFPS